MAAAAQKHGVEPGTRGRGLRRGVAWGLAAVVGALATAPLALTSAAGAEDECVPVAVLAFRGSGEDNIKSSVTSHEGSPHRYGDTDLVTNGWEGNMLSRLLAAFAEVEIGGFAADSVPVIGVGAPDADNAGYPAVSVDWRALWSIQQSAEDGVAAAEGIIDEFKTAHSAGCATQTKFIAVGYSQGAMTARLLAQQNTVDVVGVINFGDPIQRPNGTGNSGEGKAGNGVLRGAFPIFQSRWDAYYDLDIDKSAVCHRDDPFCSFRPGTVAQLGDPFDHENYMTGDNADEAAEKAHELAELARRIHREAAETERPDAARADVVFAIDTTGSMWPYIAQAVAVAEAVAEATLTSSTGSRVGLVEYRDHGDEFVAREVVPLTADFEDLTGGLESLVADGGGDWPEAVYSGIVTAAGLDFRADAARSIILLGDAPPHDPEPVTGYTATSVIERLRGTPFAGETRALSAASMSAAAAPAVTAEESASPIVLYSLGADPTMEAALAPIVAATGGLSFSLDNADGVTEALRLALEDTLEAPTARIGVSAVATVGVETSVSAVSSTAGDPVLTYEFDLDGDGTYETSSDSPVVRTTFDTPGAHEVGVRVSDSRARSDVARTTVDVAPAEALEPAFDPDSPELTVVVEPGVVQAGDAVQVTAAGADLAGGALLLVPGDSPWGAAPALEIDPLPAGWEGELVVPEDLAPGTYQVTLVTSGALHGSAGLEVRAAQVEEPTTPAQGETPSPTPTSPSPTQGTSEAPSDSATDGKSRTTPPPSAGKGRLATTGVEVGGLAVGALAIAMLGLAIRRRATAGASS